MKTSAEPGGRAARGPHTGKRSRPPRLGTRGQPEESRAAILKAAVGEFAEYGIAGARTDAIARAAHVNKALLYYYFKDKDALYEAVLDHVFSGLRARVMPVLESKLPPRQKMLEYLGTYFDYIAANPRFPRVVQGEWMRSGAGTARMQRVAQEYFRPIFEKLVGVLREGTAAGEFRAVNPMDFLPSVAAVIVFYFTAAPLMKTLMKVDPLSEERIRERRTFVLDFISTALFV
ncbi:MAG: TetR/AcrR family transcriptional regulator [Terriglobales bacterium]|jgi:TetR/AcrR family transcriptional regulator